MPAFVALGRLDAAAYGSVRGPQIVLWLVFLVIAADIGAYFVGRGFGRHKLAPAGESRQDLGGRRGRSLRGRAGRPGPARAHFGLPAILCVVCGCAVGIFSVVGDLTESMFKRSSGLKDSGTILPGHGGILDRIDSVTAAAPLYALGLFGSGVIK